MKYVLIYEFDVEIYRRAPTVRFYLNNIMLADSILKKAKNIGIIEFDYTGKDTNDFKIEFINSDSNYTNGFITKSTLITPKCLHILPSFLFENFKHHYELQRPSNYSLNSIIRRYQRMFSKKNYGRHRKTGDDFLRTQKFKKGFEYIKHFYRDRNSWPENILEFIPFNGNESLLDHKIGVSKVFNKTLYKKHNLFFAKKKIPGYMHTDCFAVNYITKIAKQISDK